MINSHWWWLTITDGDWWCFCLLIVTDGGWWWLTFTKGDLRWLIVTDSWWRWLTMTNSDWQWLTVTDSDWRWPTMTDGDWWWVMFTDGNCRWLTVTYCDWQWLAVNDKEALFSCISYLSPGLSFSQLLLGDLIDRTGQGKNSVIRTSILPKLCSTLVDWPLQQQFLHFLTQHIQSWSLIRESMPWESRSLRGEQRSKQVCSSIRGYIPNT